MSYTALLREIENRMTGQGGIGGGPVIKSKRELRATVHYFARKVSVLVGRCISLWP